MKKHLSASIRASKRPIKASLSDKKALFLSNNAFYNNAFYNYASGNFLKSEFFDFLNKHYSNPASITHTKTAIRSLPAIIAEDPNK